MNLRRIKLFLFFCIINKLIFSNEVNPDEIKYLFESGIISEEDYKILINNYNSDGEYLYELRINGNLKTKTYKIILKNKKRYFPIKEFFKLIDFTNYNINKEKINIFLGDSLKKIEINKDKIKIDGDLLKDISNNSYFKKKDIYLEEEVFKKLFLKSIKIDEENVKIVMFTNFHTPEDIKIRLKETQENLENEKNKILLFTNKRELFELGYLRIKFDQILRKNKSEESNKFKKDWDSFLEYQGALLYGQFTTTYDVKNNEFEDISLRYNDLWKEHTLNLNSYSIEHGGSRELELTFKKDRGYIITSDKNYIIKENVPIGSRVELLYLGFPIDVKDSINGVVEFKNSEIRSDREYLLKIYEISGKIKFKKISTTSDYNQQNKGQIEYNLNFREDNESSKIKTDSDIYYGITNNLTIGVGYRREIEEINKKSEYLENGKLEFIYNNRFFNYPYIFTVEENRLFNNFYDSYSNKNLKDKNNRIFKGQIDIDKIRLKYETEKKDKYYLDKRNDIYNIEYRIGNGFNIEYEYLKKDLYIGKDENDSKFKINYSKNLKNLLISSEYEKSLKEKDKYSVNLYYSGFRTFTTRWENKWENDGKDFETGITVFNSSNKFLDYTIEARYSEKEKDMLTFRFNLKYDNWFNFESFGDKKGNQEYKIGIDRIIDLKNPIEKINNIDSSRIKIITFIDLNDDDIYNEGEPKINNVKVKIGEKEIITNKKGEGIFYGIPNHVIYNLNPIIRKPSYVIGNNKIKIKGRSSSTLVAHIPIKPQLTLTGIINIDSSLNKNNNAKIAMYSDILITVKNLEGETLDMSIPDETGVFEITGLLPKQYYLEVAYLGIEYKIEKLSEKIKLSYLDSLQKNSFAIDMSTKVFNLK